MVRLCLQPKIRIKQWQIVDAFIFSITRGFSEFQMRILLINQFIKMKMSFIAENDFIQKISIHYYCSIIHSTNSVQ